MNKQKMLQSLGFDGYNHLMAKVIYTECRSDVFDRLNEGYPVTPLVLQMMFERGWGREIEKLIRNGSFWHHEDWNKALTIWFQGFFGDEEFINLCLHKGWTAFLTHMNVDAEHLAEHEQWDLLVERGEWQTLINHNQQKKLPRDKWKEWIPLVLQSEKREFLFQNGWYTFLDEFPKLKDQAFAAFVEGKHWKELIECREVYSGYGVREELLKDGQYELLLEMKEHRFLATHGQVGFLVKKKCWGALVRYGYATLVDWNEYYDSADGKHRKTVLKQAVEAGAVNFLKSKGYRFLAFKAHFRNCHK